MPAAAADAVRAAQTSIAAVPSLLGPSGAGLGSDSWALAGSRTITGMPLLANDPHLGPSMPAIWYQTGVHCRTVTESCPFDVGAVAPAAEGQDGLAEALRWTALDPGRTALNPPEGQVSTASQPVLDLREYACWLGEDWAYGSRGQRIVELIEGADGPLDAAGMSAIHRARRSRALPKLSISPP